MNDISKIEVLINEIYELCEDSGDELLVIKVNDLKELFSRCNDYNNEELRNLYDGSFV